MCRARVRRRGQNELVNRDENFNNKFAAGGATGLTSARYTELAEAFVHVLRAVDSAGLFDPLVAMLVELLTTRAVESAEAEDGAAYYD